MDTFTPSPSLSIAIIEDHAELCRLFVECLVDEGHTVHGYYCAEELDEHLARHTPDIIILDINLPGEDGFSIARRLRNAHGNLGIVMLTARSSETDRIRGYRHGADLYLPKPVSPAELAAAIGSMARRLNTRSTSQDAIIFDTRRILLIGKDAEVSLGNHEAAILTALLQATEHTLGHWRLIELIGRQTDEEGKTALEFTISRLRRKLLAVGAPRPSIKALHKQGYRLCARIVTNQ